MDNQDLTRLREAVARHYGHSINTPHHFNLLAAAIVAKTGHPLSVSTLKRLWGYVEGYGTVRTATLDVLAQYVDYRDWEDFRLLSDDGETSNWSTSPGVAMSTLRLGDTVEVIWRPGRRIVARYLGQGRMCVVESVRAKLAVGDTFTCTGMVNGERLVLTQVQHAGVDHVVNYVCGKNGGIRARIVES